MRRFGLPEKLRLLLACLLFACLLPGCVHPENGAWREYRIFCGLSHDGGTVSEAEWQQFCDEYVTAEFPDGYTALAATGYWKSEGAPATLREDSRIIVILAPPEAEEKVRRIARQYRRLFHQESVLVTTSPADAEFVETDFE
jgi:hypothetical protein